MSDRESPDSPDLLTTLTAIQQRMEESQHLWFAAVEKLRFSDHAPSVRDAVEGTYKATKLHAEALNYLLDLLREAKKPTSRPWESMGGCGEPI